MPVKNSGMDMQPEFDKSVSKAAAANYPKKRSAGEIQDEIRQMQEDHAFNGKAHRPS